MLYELSETADVMKWYRGLIPSAPDDLNGFFAFLTVPPAPPFPEHLHMKKMCGVVWAYAGPQEKAEETFEPIRAFKKPALDFVGPLPSRRYKACSMGSTRRVCNGTGAPIS